jgi:hypothetical protein
VSRVPVYDHSFGQNHRCPFREGSPNTKQKKKPRLLRPWLPGSCCWPMTQDCSESSELACCTLCCTTRKRIDECERALYPSLIEVVGRVVVAGGCGVVVFAPPRLRGSDQLWSTQQKYLLSSPLEVVLSCEVVICTLVFFFRFDWAGPL